jgi:RNAse (barnase) inhibitor barstar
VRSAKQLHERLARDLRLPADYGQTWTAFWGLIAKDCLLPKRLVLKGLDFLERVLPAEARRLLKYLGDYNNLGSAACAAEVDQDYRTKMFFLQFELGPRVRKTKAHVRGAIVNCWIKAPSERRAQAIAKNKLGSDWKIVQLNESYRVSREFFKKRDDGLPYYLQACVDGQVFFLHTWTDADE